LKILHIYYRFDLGGEENITLTLIRNDKKYKHEILVLSGYTSFQKHCEEKFNIIFYNLNWKSRGFINFNNWLTLYRNIKDIKPALLHTNMYNANLYGRIISVILKIPNVASVAIQYQRKKFRRGVVNFILSFSTSKFFTCSDDVKKDIVKYDMISPNKVQVVPSLSTLDFKKSYSPNIRNLIKANKNQKIFLSITRLVEQKGIIFLIESFASLIRIGLKDIKLIIIGDGPLKKNLKNLIVDLNLTKDVFLVGEILDLNPYLTQSNFYIDCSFKAGMSLSAIKAMEAGLPLVMSDVGGVRQLTSNGKFAYLCDAGSVDSISAAMKKIIKNNPPKSLEAQNYVHKNFSEKKLSAKFINVYDQILKGRNIASTL
jgi:glycosyltransferase involved in cell wall biosynthesis